MDFPDNNFFESHIIEILKYSGDKQKALFGYAFEIRNRIWRLEVITRGVIELSNYCFMNCYYCGMRKDNKLLKRYRLSYEDIIPSVIEMKEKGIQSVILQSGDDYAYKVEELVKIIKSIKHETGLHIILCLGERNKTDFEKFYNAGANMYILKLETMNPVLFKYLRPSSSFDKRLKLLMHLKDIGYEISSGFIVGLPGQTLDELREGILLLKDLAIEGASISPFIPNDQSLLNEQPYGDINISLNMIALMRIIIGSAKIPSVSAFSIIDKYGQVGAFEAGANVITINFTPKKEQRNYIIYGTKRSIVTFQDAQDAILKAGLTSAILEKPNVI